MFETMQTCNSCGGACHTQKKNISKKAPNIIAHALFEQKKGKRPSEKFK